ncbi:MAG: acyl-CoA thioesterase [Chloroflexi bacterium]|nr:acyl-CoA thioesterase [Chloroflexota bacterium]
MGKNDFRFHTTLRVRFSECDAQGIVFNGAYQNYLEVAQAEYFRNLGIVLYDESSRKHFDTASVKITLEFIFPAKVDDLLRIYSRVDSIGNTSMTVKYELYRDGTGELVHRAEVVQVNYDADSASARRVPDGLRTLIETYESSGVVRPLSDFSDLRGLIVS